MPKSRNRKNHKKKVRARNLRLASQQKEIMKKMEELKEKYDEDSAKEESEGDTGEVPFTLDNK